MSLTAPIDRGNPERVEAEQMVERLSVDLVAVVRCCGPVDRQVVARRLRRILALVYVARTNRAAAVFVEVLERDWGWR